MVEQKHAEASNFQNDKAPNLSTFPKVRENWWFYSQILLRGLLACRRVLVVTRNGAAAESSGIVFVFEVVCIRKRISTGVSISVFMFSSKLTSLLFLIGG